MASSEIVSASAEIQSPSFDILADYHGFKIDKKFILKIQKGSKNVTKEVKDSCKVLHFSSDLDFEEVLTTIKRLDPRDYPKLFIFVIYKSDNYVQGAKDEPPNKKVRLGHDIDHLKEHLQKFSERPVILQLTSENEKTSQICYKDDPSSQFNVFDQQHDDIKEIESFSSFLCLFLNNKINNLKEQMIKFINEHANSILLLRFIRTLNLGDNFFEDITLEVAKKRSEAEFLAILDAPFSDCNGWLSSHAQKYITDIVCIRQSVKKRSVKKRSVKKRSEKKAQINKLDSSVLLTAVQNQNVKLIDYLIFNLSHLIQQLSFDHQVKISTAAYETGQLDVLCNLVNIADYPFPNNFESESTNHESLQTIINERAELEVAIKSTNMDQITKFYNANLDLKVVYSINNKSALKLAMESNNFAAYNYLHLRGFCTTNPNEKFVKFKRSRNVAQQRKQNVKEALPDEQWSVNLLCNRSLIHNKRISKVQEKEYRKKIRNWYEDINKIRNDKQFLDVAASCTRLKIIFDFENDTVENVSLSGPTALGSMHSASKWIFIGAKLSVKDKNSAKQREQQIKGVLAHELCHYVMKLVYDNNENPYHEHREDLRKKFEVIVQKIDKWSKEDSKNSDDECNGIISSVYKQYHSKEFHQELIVRPMQMLAEFDDNEGLLGSLQETYKDLFDFWFNHVVPDLLNYLKRDINVIRLNRTIGLLPSIQELKYELINEDKIEKITRNKIVVVQTNVPKLLFINIHNYLKLKDKMLFDSQNILVEPEKLNNPQLWDDFKDICAENQKLNIFVDCTCEVPDELENIFVNKELHFIFIVSEKIQHDKIKNIIKKQKMQDVQKLELNYNWSDLTEESQKLLVKTKINFQNNSQPTLSELIISAHKTEEPSTSTAVNNDKEVIDGLVDVQLLNLLLKNQVPINAKEDFRKDKDEHFQFLFQQRGFIKKTEMEDKKGRKSNQTKTNKKTINHHELLSGVKKQQYILISDQAGNGKSWAMKNFTNVIRKRYPKSWVTYVDLKQFIEEFEKQKGEPEFSSFMVDHILKPEHQFEAKIFKKMYKDGKVFILFDGFDEIAPNYAKLVSKLAQNFQKNGGNQLWIATRDYFEVDLKDKLKPDGAYGINEMTEDEGTDLIVKSWILTDSKTVPKSKKDFESRVKASPKYKIYEQKAEQIIKKALISRNNSVGRPQLFKMIASGFKDEENVDNLKVLKIYFKFIESLYWRWSHDKGQIRKRANNNAQQNLRLNFFKFHEYQAISSLFPKLAEVLFPGYDDSEWKSEEIVAGGMLTIINGTVFFIHETIREYFVADAIVKALKNPQVYGALNENELLSALNEVMNKEKFKIIKTFIFHAFNEKEVLEKVGTQLKSIVYSPESFGLFFTENLENLVEFGIEVLINENYEKGRDVLYENACAIFRGTKNVKIFLKFQDFLLHFCSKQVKDLKEFIIECEVFLKIITSNFDIEIFENSVLIIKEKTDEEFVRQALALECEGREGNIFFSLAESSYLSAQKVQKYLEIMDKYFTVTEIFDLMSNCDFEGKNILEVCFDSQNEENFEILWTGIEKYFTNKKVPQKFKELVKQNIRYTAPWCRAIDMHQTLWELLLKTFEDREELKDLILQKDEDGNNFVHQLVHKNENPEIIGWTFEILKENFTVVQSQEILKSKGLLQSAAQIYNSNPVEVHQYLWEFFHKFCGSDEKFLEMLKEVDGDGRNIFQIAAEDSPCEVFGFMIQELEKLTSQNNIKEMLMNVNYFQYSYLYKLQNEAESNKSFELLQYLWNTLPKYFKKPKIVQFIKHVDNGGDNLLFNAVKRKSKEIVELTWNKMINFLTHADQIEYLKKKGKDGQNLLKYSFHNKVKVYPWVKKVMEEYKIELED
ncbi:uncharacterized protein [Chironomus tepperi]|uniref:uncharacterized protein n=1 Tax=Chironomus tepperi TaxID=113505 RepID=UPI00391F804B